MMVWNQYVTSKPSNHQWRNLWGSIRYISWGYPTVHYLEPQTTIYKWMFGETTIFYIKIWNHPIETTIYKWLFGVPGTIYIIFTVKSCECNVHHTQKKYISYVIPKKPEASLLFRAYQPCINETKQKKTTMAVSLTNKSWNHARSHVQSP